MKKGSQDIMCKGPDRWQQAKDCLLPGFVCSRPPCFRPIARTTSFLCLLWLAICYPAIAGAKDYAMVIGISEYDYESQLEGIVPLDYPDDDAEDLAVSLTEKGFTVLSLTNDDAKRRDIMNAFAELRDIITKDDSFVLFFAGHGIREVNIEHTFWLTHDTRLTSLDDNGIRLSHMMDYVSDIKAGKKLVLLDHCFSGDMRFEAIEPENSRGVSTNRPGISRGALPVEELSAVNTGRSTGIAVLAAARDQAFENPEYENGIFTEALIKAMDTRVADTNQDGKLSVTELERFLSVEVVKLSEPMGNAQTPVSVVNAQGLGDWTLFNLPEVKPNANEISTRYKEFLARWATREPSWIDQQIKVRIYQTLARWVAAQADTTKLDLEDKQAIHALEGNIDLHLEDGVEEIIIAEILNQELKIIYGI